MLREVRDEINSTTGSTATSAPPISLPDTPVPQRAEVKVNVKVIDKKFIAVMAALGGAESLRFTTHKLVLDHEFAAGAPWVTSVLANPHLVARYAAIYAGPNCSWLTNSRSPTPGFPAIKSSENFGGHILRQ
jgi:hypothetical protein